MEVRLTIVGGKANRRVLAVRLPAILGRSREADLTIAHPMVSRRHCELFEVQGLLRIRDLGSLNGTLVGGKEITEAPLRPNDEFSIGPLTFRVEYEYGGDVTVVAPTVPEDQPEEAAAPPVPPPVPGELPGGSHPLMEPPPQAGLASSNDLAAEAGGQWAGEEMAKQAPAEPSSEPAAAYPLAPPGEMPVVGPPPVPMAAGEKPGSPPSSFGDLPPMVEVTPAQEGQESPWASVDSDAASQGSQTIEPWDFISEFGGQSAAEESVLSDLASESTPFDGTPGKNGGKDESYGKLPTGEATFLDVEAGASAREQLPANGPTGAAGGNEVAPPTIPSESATSEQSAAFEPAWLEAAPCSGGTMPGEVEVQASPTVPAPSQPTAKEAQASKKEKKGWRWWPFGRRKRAEPSEAGHCGPKPSSPAEPAASSLPPGVAAGGASAPGEVAPARPASSPAAPSNSSPPSQSQAELDPELEAFLRDLQ